MDWQKISDWRLVCPPSRPSQAHLSFVRDAICKVSRNEPVAVLGSTVEYRDLLSYMGFRNVHVIEKNIDFHTNASKLLRTHPSETIVNEDWVNYRKNELGNGFSFALSHLTSGNISYQDRDKFYESVSGMLAPNGFFWISSSQIARRISQKSNCLRATLNAQSIL